ncbi:uncharacterized protein FIBRA_00736 [Fibroporia radiculosa]|uniref:Cytochrome c domain-containing protein n=1 Tax=Fibroporia radiculosa TaxID=599839 RepID=J4I837_9APHY|nr:uncharacterized protein FIBRA_00736 [Fibroporia radiculosa]CCL98731.1 predicted protein [Fibroporia radiculosa]
MTLTILVSFSLLALVVTARPILPGDAPDRLTNSSDEIHNAVQAIFQTRASRREDCLNCHNQDVRVHLTSPQVQQMYLSELDGLDAVKAVISLDPSDLSSDEKELFSLIHGQNTESLDDIDGSERPVQNEMQPTHVETETGSEKAETTSIDDGLLASPLEFFTSPLFFLTLSCIVALLSLMCVTAGLYAAYCTRLSFIGSHVIGALWSIMGTHPTHDRLVKSAGTDEEGFPEKPSHASLESKSDEEEKVEMLGPLEDELSELDGDPLLFDGETGSEEIFQDCQENLLLFPFTGKPEDLNTHESRIVSEDCVDPELLPLPISPTPFLTPEAPPSRSLASSPDPRNVQMREITESPVSKPAWSLRAADSPSFAIPSPSTVDSSPISSPKVPGALFPDMTRVSNEDQSDVVYQDRRRAYRAPVPELDIALALQLRPGLGLGADPAWLVRFLMAMFGWMTVFLGGSGTAQARAAYYV